MMIYKVFFRLILLVTILLQGFNNAQAQNGDQILDGIGETGMVARYLFNGDVRDWSRNNLHGKFAVGGVKFLEDSKFGKILSLSGAKDAYVTIPGEVLTDLESLSITAWVYLDPNQLGRCIFDFGKDAKEHFSLEISSAIPSNAWVHLTLVVDLPSKSIQTFVNAKPIGKANSSP